MEILKGLTYNQGMFKEAPIVVNLLTGHYPNGRLAIYLESEMEDQPGVFEPFAKCTTNLVDEDCPEDEVWVNDTGATEGMTDWLRENKIIEANATAGSQPAYVVYERHPLTADFQKKLYDALVASGERSRR